MYKHCMMQTINISLPTQLKGQADLLIDTGFYSSFSDLVRTALRNLISQNKYDLWTNEAKYELKQGKALAFKDAKNLTKYLSSKAK